MNTDSRITDCEALKAEIDSYRPLDEYTLNQLKAYYRVGLTYANNALEGNTLTETETKVVLEDGITIGGKPMKDHLEAIGHAKAYDLLYDLIQNPSVTEADLLALHRLVVEGIDGTKPGQYRSKPVIITGTAYVPLNLPTFQDRCRHSLRTSFPTGSRPNIPFIRRRWPTWNW